MYWCHQQVSHFVNYLYNKDTFIFLYLWTRRQESFDVYLPARIQTFDRPRSQNPTIAKADSLFRPSLTLLKSWYLPPVNRGTLDCLPVAGLCCALHLYAFLHLFYAVYYNAYYNVIANAYIRVKIECKRKLGYEIVDNL